MIKSHNPNSTSLPTITRRELIESTAGAAALAGLVGVGLGTAGTAHAAQTRRYTLQVVELNGGPKYNGQILGPTIIADPGDTIEVLLINKLDKNPDNDDCPADHNQGHGANTTNLHTHGLHISPDTDSTGNYDADNVFLKITPKDQVISDCTGTTNFRNGETTFRFELPADHTSGTYWYHAHKHGSTAQQVIAGLAGPLIVRDRPGAMPDYIAEAPERIFMLTPGGAIMVAADGSGTANPTITLAPGSVERWRVINANPFGDNFVRIGPDSEDVELWQIAFDGITLSRRLRVDPSNDADPWENHAALAPGNRTDFMVRVPRDAGAGSVALSAISARDEILHSDVLTLASRPVEINVQIDGDPVDRPWSERDDLPAPNLSTHLGDVVEERTVVFERVDGNFAIDGESYDGKVKKTMALGSTEKWVVQNVMPQTHPFHIHVNPFLVTEINNVPLAEDDPLRRWQDTIALPVAEDGTPGSITFLSHFANFTGKFVIHCHILFHEDAGMMQVIEVA